MPWEVKLSNNEVVQQNEANVSHWRMLSERCKSENLKIKEFKFDNKIIHEDGDAYFVIYDVIVLNVLVRPIPHAKIGAGCIYKKRNKCRIKWFKAYGNPPLFSEIIRSIPDVYKEISIEKVSTKGMENENIKAHN